ncbi:MAG: site-specific integrase, partial [Defluviitaleaceae bacterium]|nr:site-specific integrase [Defluviitaleaceae bacterium]
MKTTDFAECLASYLTMYLPGHAGLSSDTIASYRDTFKLIFKFAEHNQDIRIERIKLSDFNIDFVMAFLLWLENERGCSISTRNQRLTAIRAFVKYARIKKPEYLYEAQKILDFKSKKTPETLASHLTPDCIKDIIDQPDRYDRYGRRDVALLSLLYDSAARVSEVCDLCVRDIRTHKPYAVTLMGKGRKPRTAPLMEETALAVKKHIEDNYPNPADKPDYPLFFNHQRNKLTRAGVAYILKK